MNEHSNSLHCLDLTKILQVLKMILERLILELIIFDCIVVLLPNALVGGQHWQGHCCLAKTSVPLCFEAQKCVQTYFSKFTVDTLVECQSLTIFFLI